MHKIILLSLSLIFCSNVFSADQKKNSEVKEIAEKIEGKKVVDTHKTESNGTVEYSVTLEDGTSIGCNRDSNGVFVCFRYSLSYEDGFKPDIGYPENAFMSKNKLFNMLERVFKVLKNK